GLFRTNADVARSFAWVYHVRYAAFQADVRDGVPARFIADRIAYYPASFQRENFHLLYESGFRPLAGIAAEPPLEAVTIPLPPGSGIPPWQPLDRPAPPRCDLPPPGRFVSAVRIHYHA